MPSGSSLGPCGKKVTKEEMATLWIITAGNSGGQYRNDNVDIEATTDAGGGFNVGWTQAVSDNTVRVGFHFGADNVNDAWLDNVTLK